MKKVLFVAKAVRSHILVFHLPYLKWFKEQGYEVHVCASNDFKENEPADIPYCDKYYDVPFSRDVVSFENINASRKMKEIMSENDYELIHCHTPVAAAIARISAMGARKNGTKVMYTAHGFHFYDGAPFVNWLLFYPVERILSRVTDVLITINQEDYNRAKSFTAKALEYVPGVGVDLTKYSSTSSNKNKLRDDYGLKAEDTVLINVGELTNNKNQETLIRAVHNLDNENIKLLICGEGDKHQQLQLLIDELGLNQQVKLMGYRTDINRLLNLSDIYLFPSFREGLSLSLMEAMVSGLPVVCSNIRGNVDLIDNEQGGYVLEPNDMEGFSSAIAKISSDRELAHSMGQYNQEKIELFSLDKVLPQMISIYEKTIQG